MPFVPCPLEPIDFKALFDAACLAVSLFLLRRSVRSLEGRLGVEIPARAEPAEEILSCAAEESARFVC